MIHIKLQQLRGKEKKVKVHFWTHSCMGLSAEYQLPGKELFLGATSTKSHFLLCFSGSQCLVVLLSTQEGMLGSSIAAAVEGGWEETHRALHRHSQTSTGTFWMGQFAADGAAVQTQYLTSQLGNPRLRPAQNIRFTCSGKN